MAGRARIRARKYRALQRGDIDRMPELARLSAEQRLEMKAVSAVLPFRVNEYVAEELIDWSKVPDDPIYQLTFPQPGMLALKAFRTMLELVRKGAPEAQVGAAARRIQSSLNPHPAGQIELNVPRVGGRPLRGLQHKYRETVLFFPSQGQTCHAYCTYCFRWAQFVGIDELKFASREAEGLVDYLLAHREVSSVLLTGGDPLIMKTSVLRRYVEPLLAPELEHITSIRIGTKALAYWPYRFVTDPDADDLLRLFEEVRAAGRHIALMGHYTHPRELETPVAQAAIQRVRRAGAVVRCQAPIVRHVNDKVRTWANMWRLQVQLGAVPYYMFVERDTGPKNYFEVPLARSLEIFNQAYRLVSGLARTVRGPSMSATPGKVLVDGVAEIHGEQVFVLKFLQARDPEWVGEPFFARYDPDATWLDQLVPAFGEKKFFFESELRRIRRTRRQQAWGDSVPDRRRSVVFGHVEWE
ncbi:MAG: lysine 2,3-aminomutase [Myxococcales bacterium]|nr:lysine 2,3-aminomutase [Myxococcales bacterium]